MSDIYPKLCDAKKKSCKNLTVINDNVYASLDMGAQLVKILNPLLIRQPSNINTTKLNYMPTWNKDDSII